MNTCTCSLVTKMPSELPQQFYLSFILFVIYLTSTSGCWRRKVQSDYGTQFQMNFNSTTTERVTHRLDCEEEEQKKIGCLNGGTCSVVLLSDDVRHVQCRCTSDYTGQRCELQYIDPELWSAKEAREETVKLAIVLSVGLAAVVLLTILIIVTVAYLRQRRKRLAEKRKKKAEEQAQQENDLHQSRPLATPHSVTDARSQRILLMEVTSV